MNVSKLTSLKWLTALLLAAQAVGSLAANPVAITASDHDGNTPDNTVDDDLSTRWSANGDGQWIAFDMGSETRVNSVDIAFYKGDQRSSTFDVQTSTNGSDWNTVLSSAESSGSSLALESFPFTEINARYVRYVGYGNSSNSWNSLTEIRVRSEGGSAGSSSSSSSSAAGPDIPSIITDGSLFDLEGENPSPLVNSHTLQFVPLEAQYTSPNGNGWRHEYKVAQEHRVAMSAVYELFEADVKVEMSDGGKTIVAQHHASDLGTIMKLYVSDSNESGFYDSVAYNGIFDVYVRLRNTSGSEEKYALGTIESGETFDLKVVNDYGTVYVYSMGSSFGIPVEDDSASYFKFGNYLQSQDTRTMNNCGNKGDSSSFAQCYADLGITESKVTMTNVVYERSGTSNPPGNSSSSQSSSSSSAAVLSASASTDDGNVASNVLDGDFATRWSGNGNGQWLQLDLGNAQQVTGVNIAFYNGDQRTSYFDVLTSTDGSSWNTALSGVESSGSSVGLESFSFAGVNARYVRYVGYGNSSNSWNSLTEMSVAFGSSSSSSSSNSSSVPSSSSSSSGNSSSHSSSPWEGGGNTYTASPDEVGDILASASGGDEIVVTGSGEISIKNMNFSSPVMVRAASVGGTHLTNATIDNSSNIILQGFVFGPNNESTYLKIVNSTNIQVLRNVFDHKGVRTSQTSIVTTQASEYISIGYNEFRDKNEMFTSSGEKLTGSYIKTQFDDPMMTKHLHVYRNHFKNILPYVASGTTPAGDSDREVMAMGIADSQDVVTNNVVEYNLFENCDGENEIITVKTSNNIFRHNTFKNSMGSLSFRLGSNNQAYGNYFYGVGPSASWSDDNYQTGGIRVYGNGHQVYDNYMENLTGTSWRRPVLIDSGDTSDSTGNDSHETPSYVSVYNNIIVNSAGGGIHIGSDNYGNMPYGISVDNNLVVGEEGILFNNYANSSSNTWAGNQVYATGSATAVGGGSLSSAEVLVLSDEPNISKPSPLTASEVGPGAP